MFKLTLREIAKGSCFNGPNKIKNVVLLSAISLARYESFQEATAGEEPPTEIEVTAKHLETVLKNKEQFNDDYKRATGFYPDQMAAERFLRAEK